MGIFIDNSYLADHMISYPKIQAKKRIKNI